LLAGIKFDDIPIRDEATLTALKAASGAIKVQEIFQFLILEIDLYNALFSGVPPKTGKRVDRLKSA
jgi:hypothetical protein